MLGPVTKWTAGILGLPRNYVRKLTAAGSKLLNLVCHIASTKWVSLIKESAN